MNIELQKYSHKYIHVFSCCFLTRGASRGLIFDSLKGKSETIPLILIDILENDIAKYTLIELYQQYETENHAYLDEYFIFLIQKEYIFFCDTIEEKKMFPPILLDWETPHYISNCIIDINKNSDFDFNRIFEELEELLCPNLQIRCFEFVSIDQIEYILQVLKDRKSYIRYVELYLKFDINKNINDYTNLLENNKRLQKIGIHSCTNEFINLSKSLKLEYIHTTSMSINNSSHCGLIDKLLFSNTIQTFTESQKHNTCLNRKISIDFDGEIKNCPSFTKSYGNIKNTSLSFVLNQKGFKDLWYIHKDQIEVCKDCEFRHICTDCRAIIQDNNNIYSKPAKCAYNPYTASWEE